MIMELTAVEQVIETEIANGLTQKQVALTYALGLLSSWPTDWARVNNAILSRWPKGLNRVKEMAWKLVEEKRKQTSANTTDVPAGGGS